MSYQEYRTVRNAAWKILLDHGIDRLPVDLNIICKGLGVRVYPYSSVDGLPEAARQTDGLTFYLGGTPIILYDQSKTPERIRFTAAHELGHLVLGHVAPRRRTTAGMDDPFEQTANLFAARLLAPACVLWGLGVHTPEEIATLCHISRQSARLRAERMEALFKRGKFLTSPLERSVYEQFRPFIEEVHLHRLGK